MNRIHVGQSSIQVQQTSETKNLGSLRCSRKRGRGRGGAPPSISALRSPPLHPLPHFTPANVGYNLGDLATSRQPVPRFSFHDFLSLAKPLR